MVDVEDISFSHLHSQGLTGMENETLRDENSVSSSKGLAESDSPERLIMETEKVPSSEGQTLSSLGKSSETKLEESSFMDDNPFTLSLVQNDVNQKVTCVDKKTSSLSYEGNNDAHLTLKSDKIFHLISGQESVTETEQEFSNNCKTFPSSVYHNTVNTETSSDDVNSTSLSTGRNDVYFHETTVTVSPSITEQFIYLKGKYFCSYCNMSYRDEVCMFDHLKFHHGFYSGSPPFECTYCKKTFQSRIHFTRHVRTHTGEKPFICSYCTERFVSRWNLNRHAEESGHTEKGLFCSKCSSNFKNLKIFKEHIKAHHHFKYKHFGRHKSSHDSTKREQTSVCSTTTGDTSMSSDPAQADQRSEKHVKKHTDLLFEPFSYTDGQYKCGYCSKIFLSKGDIFKHLRNHNDGMPYKCPYCEKTLPHKTSFTVHIRVHTGERPYTCSHCNRKFIDKRSYNSHRKVRGHTDDGLFCCTCSLYFDDLKTFEVHMKTHYKCSHCEKSFSNQLDLYQHTRRYHKSVNAAKLRTINCTTTTTETCDALQADQVSDNHVKEHPNPVVVPFTFVDGLYNCVHCSKTFCTRYKVLKHLRDHNGGNPYKCHYCEKTFSRKADFISHVRVHTGERPYVCSFCKSAFVDKRALNRHERSKGHSEKGLFCVKCSLKFIDQGSFTSHQRIMHQTYFSKDSSRIFSINQTQTGTDLRASNCILQNKPVMDHPATTGNPSILSSSLDENKDDRTVTEKPDQVIQRMHQTISSTEPSRTSSNQTPVSTDLKPSNCILQNKPTMDHSVTTENSSLSNSSMDKDEDIRTVTDKPDQQALHLVCSDNGNSLPLYPQNMAGKPANNIKQVSKYCCIGCQKDFNNFNLLLEHFKVHNVHIATKITTTSSQSRIIQNNISSSCESLQEDVKVSVAEILKLAIENQPQ